MHWKTVKLDLARLVLVQLLEWTDVPQETKDAPPGSSDGCLSNWCERVMHLEKTTGHIVSKSKKTLFSSSEPGNISRLHRPESHIETNSTRGPFRSVLPTPTSHPDNHHAHRVPERRVLRYLEQSGHDNSYANTQEVHFVWICFQIQPPSICTRAHILVKAATTFARRKYNATQPTIPTVGVRQWI